MGLASVIHHSVRAPLKFDAVLLNLSVPPIKWTRVQFTHPHFPSLYAGQVHFSLMSVLHTNSHAFLVYNHDILNVELQLGRDWDQVVANIIQFHVPEAPNPQVSILCVRLFFFFFKFLIVVVVFFWYACELICRSWEYRFSGIWWWWQS